MNNIILSIGTFFMCVGVAFLAWFVSRNEGRPYNRCLDEVINDVSYHGMESFAKRRGWK